MSDYVVTAPCAVVRSEDGSVRYLYQGAPVPSGGLFKGEVARLRDGGFIGQITSVAVPQQAGPPARNGSREDWAAYALTLGATEADLTGQTRDFIRDLCDLKAASA